MMRIEKRKIVIAVDGPSGVGKSTVSKRVAARLGLSYIDTGAMYRAVALGAKTAKIDIDNKAELEEFCAKLKIEYDNGKVVVNGTDYTDSIRTEEASTLASLTSSKSPVRRVLVEYQQRLAAEGGVVMEGRDIGTVVLPDIRYKFFLTASHEVRAERRHKEQAGEVKSAVSDSMRERDKTDSTRTDSPLVRAKDAIEIDTGALDIDGVVERILASLEDTA